MNKHLKQQELLDIVNDVINVDNDIFDFGYQLFDVIMEEIFHKDCFKNPEEIIDLIYWWLYDYQDGCRMYGEDEVEILVDTPELLWDFIIKNYALSSN